MPLGGTCSHLGGPLGEGTLEEGHGVLSVAWLLFRPGRWRVVDGPATYPQPWFETRIQHGQIEIRAHRDRT